MFALQKIGLMSSLDNNYSNMEIKCLFWNLKDLYNKERLDFLNEVSKDYDIIILAEAYGAMINTSIIGFSLIQPMQTSGREWIKFFKNDSSTSFKLTRVKELFHKRIVVASLKISAKMDINILGVHLNSKTGLDEKTQLLLNDKAAQEIHQFLREVNNRAILIGDFNHNPFEVFINSSLTLNSIPNRDLVKKLRYRTHTRKRKTIFYNPMWNFLGDHDFVNNTPKYNGTFFYKNDKHKIVDQLHWNLLDQVLVSEPIIDCLNPNMIQIINEYVNTKLGKTISFTDEQFYKLNNTYMNPDLSDHLPLKFTIDTTKLK